MSTRKGNRKELAEQLDESTSADEYDRTPTTSRTSPRKVVNSKKNQQSTSRAAEKGGGTKRDPPKKNLPTKGRAKKVQTPEESSEEVSSQDEGSSGEESPLQHRRNPSESPARRRDQAAPSRGRSKGINKNVEVQRGKQNIPPTRATPRQGRQEERTAVPPPPRRKKGLPRALKDIVKYQKSVEPLIPKAPFGRLVREMLQRLSLDNTGMRITPDALEALRESSGTYISSTLSDANRITSNRDRVTLQVRDLQLLMLLRGPGIGSSFN